MPPRTRKPLPSNPAFQEGCWLAPRAFPGRKEPRGANHRHEAETTLQVSCGGPRAHSELPDLMPLFHRGAETPRNLLMVPTGVRPGLRVLIALFGLPTCFLKDEDEKMGAVVFPAIFSIVFF